MMNEAVTGGEVWTRVQCTGKLAQLVTIFVLVFIQVVAVFGEARGLSEGSHGQAKPPTPNKKGRGRNRRQGRQAGEPGAGRVGHRGANWGRLDSVACEHGGQSGNE